MMNEQKNEASRQRQLLRPYFKELFPRSQSVAIVGPPKENPKKITLHYGQDESALKTDKPLIEEKIKKLQTEPLSNPFSKNGFWYYEIKEKKGLISEKFYQDAIKLHYDWKASVLTFLMASHKNNDKAEAYNFFYTAPLFEKNLLKLIFEFGSSMTATLALSLPPPQIADNQTLQKEITPSS